MYGEGQNSNAILAQLDKALSEGKGSFNMSGGEQLRDYLPVEKVAEYIVRIVAQDKITGIINCCRGKPISIRNLVENHLKKRKKSIHFNLGHYPYPDHEPMAFWGDNKKLMLALGKYYESD
jgi:dTDP-6-deoxy-L-talose 4-dehydrogenase (NAD+)